MGAFFRIKLRSFVFYHNIKIIFLLIQQFNTITGNVHFANYPPLW